MRRHPTSRVIPPVLLLFKKSPQDPLQLQRMVPVFAPTYDVAPNRRKALMGFLGPMALIQTFGIFSIAWFACIGGLLYSHN